MSGWGAADDEPLVRPFFLTRGRTVGRLPLDAMVVALGPFGGPGGEVDRVGDSTAGGVSAGPLEAEHQRILTLCSRPLTVAEVAGHLGLPLGVVRVLLDDLVCRGLVEIASARPSVDEALLDRLIRGVERL